MENDFADIEVQRHSERLTGHGRKDEITYYQMAVPNVTFREDQSRVRDRNTATNLAWSKRFGLSLLKQQDDKHSIAMRRRVAG